MKLQAIDVIARQDSDGNWILLSFTWLNTVYRVEGSGRRWQDEVGEHFLVMANQNQVFELIYTREKDWRLKLRPGQPMQPFV